MFRHPARAQGQAAVRPVRPLADQPLRAADIRDVLVAEFARGFSGPDQGVLLLAGDITGSLS